MALAISPLFWSQATVTEVHALNGLIAALLLALLVRSARAPAGARYGSAGLAFAIGLAWGLGLGNHPTALLSAPLVALALWRIGSGRRLGVIGMLSGLAVYFYLPLRAASAPPVNWGDPRTVDRVWWMVSGALYRAFVFSLPQAYLPARLLAWLGVMARQFGWPGIALVALGGAALWKRDRALLGATAATILLCSVFAIGYNTSDSYLYLVPALVCLALWLGVGADWLLGAVAGAMEGRTWPTLVLSLLILALLLAAVICRYPLHDLSADRAARDFGTAVFEQAPPRAILLAQEDAHTFALWYYRHALGRRVDVSIVDLGLLAQEWYVSQLSRELGSPVDPLLAGERDLQRLAECLRRPVCAIQFPPLTLACEVPRAMEER
jgi:hypothetical protein